MTKVVVVDFTVKEHIFNHSIFDLLVGIFPYIFREDIDQISQSTRYKSIHAHI